MGMVTDSQFHVLAVDDSIIDRKLIERLLKTSSYQGNNFINFAFVKYGIIDKNLSIKLINV